VGSRDCGSAARVLENAKLAKRRDLMSEFSEVIPQKCCLENTDINGGIARGKQAQEENRIDPAHSILVIYG
jgi:hypothetical protein